jgi:glycerophosphoryl diester phosphodiesterase
VRKPYFAEPLPRVFAHRGFAVNAPENTLLAFQRALDLGITHIETDVHASSDGIAVISHDADLARVAGRPGIVGDLSLRELRAIDLGHGETFSSLAEVLDAFPESKFNIDIKADAAIDPTVSTIRAAGAIDRVLVTSFSERRRSKAVAQLPGVATSASAAVFARALVAAHGGWSTAVRRALRDVDAVQVPERAAGLAVASPRIIRALHAAGVEVHIWTINDVATMSRLLDLGVDGLVTDRADLAVALVAERAV